MKLPAGIPREGDNRMRNRVMVCSPLVLAFIGCGLVAGEASISSVRPQASAPVSEPYVQVTSVRIEPSTIRKTDKPSTATVIVQVMLRGQAPRNPQAIVEVGTYSSNPPGINVKYENPTRTVALKREPSAVSSVTTIKFTVEAGPQTMPGKLVIAASIGGATKGINVKNPPDSPEDWHAELVMLDP
jgi:hypothetical protein